MWRTIVATATFTVPVTITVLDLFGYVAQVEGVSMQPVLNPVSTRRNDYVLLNRWEARQCTFDRGQIVTLTSPSNPGQQIIKRIVALEGDRVRTRTYKEAYVQVPKGHCWLEGDRHDCSIDSNMFGPVPVGLINASVSCIVWPPARWRRLEPLCEADRLLAEPLCETDRLLAEPLCEADRLLAEPLCESIIEPESIIGSAVKPQPLQL